MRYSDLIGKELIDVAEGTRLGLVSQSDLLIDVERGVVKAILLPRRGGLFSARELAIPWCAIRKIGIDFIIIDSSTATEAEGEVRVSRKEREPLPAPAAALSRAQAPAEVPAVSQLPAVAQMPAQTPFPAPLRPVEDPQKLNDEDPQQVLKRLAAGGSAAPERRPRRAGHIHPV
ncbi:MAG TPA: YlmC/YmxH family sporulation protein [Firmicutes bacterium]|nr:YlmC/YmxH family sporulation protein [Bacillota bacterium]